MLFAALGSSTESPMEAGSLRFCLGSGAARRARSSSSSRSSPAPSSSCSVGSYGSEARCGVRRPVRYQRDGGTGSSSREAGSSSKGPTRSARSASTSCARASALDAVAMAAQLLTSEDWASIGVGQERDLRGRGLARLPCLLALRTRQLFCLGPLGVELEEALDDLVLEALGGEPFSIRLLAERRRRPMHPPIAMRHRAIHLLV